MRALRSIFQLHVSLEHIEPLIWRRVLVLSTTELGALHAILQVVMGWKNCHLHQFLAGKVRYGQPDPDFDDGTSDEKGIRVGALLKAKHDSILYEYDFGDGWIHRILLEDILPFTQVTRIAVCLGGERACPPEDVGGPPGYQDFLSAFDNPAHPEHEDMHRWAGKRFAPANFDAAAVSRKLAKLKG
jgi:hypothetical protein